MHCRSTTYRNVLPLQPPCPDRRSMSGSIPRPRALLRQVTEAVSHRQPRCAQFPALTVADFFHCPWIDSGRSSQYPSDCRSGLLSRKEHISISATKRRPQVGAGEAVSFVCVQARIDVNRIATQAARQCMSMGASVPSDHLGSGIKNTVTRSGASSDDRIGEPGKSAPRVGAFFCKKKNTGGGCQSPALSPRYDFFPIM